MKFQIGDLIHYFAHEKLTVQYLITASSDSDDTFTLSSIPIEFGQISYTNSYTRRFIELDFRLVTSILRNENGT